MVLIIALAQAVYIVGETADLLCIPWDHHCYNTLTRMYYFFAGGSVGRGIVKGFLNCTPSTILSHCSLLTYFIPLHSCDLLVILRLPWFSTVAFLFLFTHSLFIRHIYAYQTPIASNSCIGPSPDISLLRIVLSFKELLFSVISAGMHSVILAVLLWVSDMWTEILFMEYCFIFISTGCYNSDPCHW